MIKTMIVDDDPFIRESLKVILDMDGQIEVVFTCMNGDEAHRYVSDGSPVDVVLMDIRMPVCDGVEGTKKLKSTHPHIGILILTTFDDDEYIVEAIKHGAGGYLLKNIPPDRIIEGIKTVHKGNMLIHPDIAKKLGGLLRPESSPEKNKGKSIDQYGLTPTELTITEKVADGFSNKEIAQELFLSEGTVKNYISEILGKLSLRDRTQLAIFYLKHTV